MENQAVFLDCPGYLGRVMKCQRDNATTVARPTDTASHAKHAGSSTSVLSREAPDEQA